MHHQWSINEDKEDLFGKTGEELEAYRLREVTALIDSAPLDYQRRLRGIQFQIDTERDRHSCALGACTAIFNMMHISIHIKQIEGIKNASSYPG